MDAMIWTQGRKRIERIIWKSDRLVIPQGNFVPRLQMQSNIDLDLYQIIWELVLTALETINDFRSVHTRSWTACNFAAMNLLPFQLNKWRYSLDNFLLSHQWWVSKSETNRVQRDQIFIGLNFLSCGQILYGYDWFALTLQQFKRSKNSKIRFRHFRVSKREILFSRIIIVRLTPNELSGRDLTWTDGTKIVWPSTAL